MPQGGTSNHTSCGAPVRIEWLELQYRINTERVCGCLEASSFLISLTECVFFSPKFLAPHPRRSAFVLVTVTTTINLQATQSRIRTHSHGCPGLTSVRKWHRAAHGAGVFVRLQSSFPSCVHGALANCACGSRALHRRPTDRNAICNQLAIPGIIPME
jgi:hypothetical protein